MNSLLLVYLRGLVTGVPVLNETLEHCLQDWGTEAPPATVVFGKIGDAIAENLAVIPDDVRQKIFAGIEGAMVSQDSALKTAMATGLVEALVAGADKKAGLWTELETLLGPASMRHAATWRNFGV